MIVRRYYLATVVADDMALDHWTGAECDFDDRHDAFVWIADQPGAQRWVSLVEDQDNGFGVEIVEIECYGDTEPAEADR